MVPLHAQSLTRCRRHSLSRYTPLYLSLSLSLSLSHFFSLPLWVHNLLAVRFSVWLRHMEKHFHFTFVVVVVVVAHLVLSSRILALFLSLPSLLSLSLQDYVTVYDGYTTRDPIILKFCGGGQAVPAAVSSGPELLVEFSTSPFGTFTGTSSQVLPLYGFQLEVGFPFPPPFAIGNHQVIFSCLPG